MLATRLATSAASAFTLRSSLGAATTVYPSLCNWPITPFQLDESAKAPWTRTMVGFSAAKAAGLMAMAANRAVRISERIMLELLVDGVVARRVAIEPAAACA